MGKTILILNGSPRANGNTVGLIEAFRRGAEEAGHTVDVLNLQRMNIHACLGCMNGGKDPQNPCVQRDDMQRIYPLYEKADAIVFASPMYFWSVTSQLKAVIDRLYAIMEKSPEYQMPLSRCVMLMAAEGDGPDNFEPIEHYYHSLLRQLGWENLGEVYAGGVARPGDIAGHPALDKAYQLGKSI